MDPAAFVSTAPVISKSVQQRGKLGCEVGASGWCRSQTAALAPSGQPLCSPPPPPAAGGFGVAALTISDAGVEEFSQKEPGENKRLSSAQSFIYILLEKKICTSKYFGKL